MAGGRGAAGRGEARPPARVLLAALVVAVAAGCDPARQEGGTLRVVTRDPVLQLDPHTVDDPMTQDALGNVFETLVRFDADMALAPSLARSWTSPAETTWRLELVRDARFHDGRPLRARDVKYSIERARTHPRSWLKAEMALVEGVELRGEFALELHTAGPAPLLLNNLARLRIVPEGDDAPAVGTGPYRAAAFAGDGSLVLARNDAYWRGRPRWERVTVRPVEGPRERTAALLRGEADVVDMPSEETLAPVQRDARFRVVRHPAMRLAILGLRVVDDPRNPFADPDVRRAVDLALDRRELVRTALGGAAEPASQLAPPGVFGYVPDATVPAGDLAAARAVLARSRHPRGFRDVLLFADANRAIGAFVAGHLRAIGIDLLEREVTWEEQDALMMAQQAPAYVFHMTFPTADTSDLLQAGFHTRVPERGDGLLNFSGHSDPAMDGLIEQSRHEMRSEVRARLLRQAMQAALASRAWIPLCLRSHVFATRADLAWKRPVLSSAQARQYDDIAPVR